MTVRDPELPIAGTGPVFLNAAWTAASQVVIMALGASMGIVLLLRFGKSAQTDAAFAANGMYGLLLVLWLGLRITISPRLAEGPSVFATFDHFLGASMSLLLVSGIVMVGFGDGVAGLLSGRLGIEAQATIRTSLAIFWIALIAQLGGALGAALLGVRGDFGLSGLAYGLGAVGAVISLLLLPSSMGVLALPVSTVAGSVLMAVVMLARLVQLGYVPHLDTLLEGLGHMPTTMLLLVASISPVAWQLSYLISLAFAARLGPGAVTLYTYSFAAAGIVTGITASASSLVMAGRLSQTWDRQPESLMAYLKPMLRAALLIVLPALALAAWLGQEVIELVLGQSLSPSDARTIVITFVLLGGMMIATSAIQVPTLAAYTLSWYGKMALLALVTNGVHLGLTALGYMTGESALLGLAASIATLLALVLVTSAVYGTRSGSPLLIIGTEVGQLAVVCALAFVPVRLIGAAVGDGLWDVPLVITAMGLFALLLHKWLPEHYELASRIAQEVLRAGPRGKTTSRGITIT